MLITNGDKYRRLPVHLAEIKVILEWVTQIYHCQNQLNSKGANLFLILKPIAISFQVH